MDWQVSRFGSPVLDISYYILSSTTKELREHHFDELINIYYQTLAESVRKCGSDPEQLFSFNDLQDQFKKFGKYGVVMAPCLLQIIVSDPNNIVNMDELAANVDGNTGTLDMAKFDEHTELAFKNRITDVIEHAIKYGWLQSSKS